MTETCFENKIVVSEILSEFAPRIVKIYFNFLKMNLQSNLGQTTNLGDVIEYIIDTIINNI